MHESSSKDARVLDQKTSPTAARAVKLLQAAAFAATLVPLGSVPAAAAPSITACAQGRPCLQGSGGPPVVPEPASLALLGAGLAGFLYRLRSKRPR